MKKCKRCPGWESCPARQGNKCEADKLRRKQNGF